MRGKSPSSQPCSRIRSGNWPLAMSSTATPSMGQGMLSPNRREPSSCFSTHDGFFLTGSMNLRILFATLLLSSHALLNAQEKRPTNDNSTSPRPASDQTRRGPMSSPAGEGLVLAESGRSNYVVAVSTSATPAEKFAAETMSKYLKRVTGAEFPVVGEDMAGTKTISIGNTRFAAQSGITGLGAEEWVQRAAGDRLVIAGGTPRATAYGVFDFLERYAGVYQLAVDTEIVPSHPTLRIPSLDKRTKPAFRSRHVFDPAGARGLLSLIHI